MNLKIVKSSFFTDISIQSEVSALRGYIASLCPENPLFHQHQKKEDGCLIYSYPKIQYKIVDEIAMIIGIEEGAIALKNIIFDLNKLNLNGKSYEIISKKIEEDTVVFHETSAPIMYRFMSPWFALNVEGYKRYKKRNDKQKKEQLQSVVINNIISIAKSLGYVITSRIQADVFLYETMTSFKGISLLGFLGKFSVNFSIPDYLGIGKSVSRGFGTIKKVDNTT